jgi:hypothetical protein
VIKLTRPDCPNPAAAQRDYKCPQNKDALKTASFDKCMYCESKISHVYYGDVEHIRPKSTYPHLEFVWENLGFVCAKCNGEKADKYDETNPFINPFDENPIEFLVAFGTFLFHRAGNERGEVTIKEIGLNRPHLLERRHERMKSLQNLNDKIEKTTSPRLKEILTEELLKELRDETEYSLVGRAFISAIRR